MATNVLSKETEVQTSVIDPIMYDMGEQAFLEWEFVNPINAAIAKIEALDFAQQKQKMFLPQPEGCGWTAEQADKAEELYKQFLKLQVIYPNETIVPTTVIDEFWHKHILDTRKYDRETEDIFGQKLHHYPYFGLRDSEDAKELQSSFQRTCELFKKEFGTDLKESSSMCQRTDEADCSACTPKTFCKRSCSNTCSSCT